MIDDKSDNDSISSIDTLNDCDSQASLDNESDNERPTSSGSSSSSEGAIDGEYSDSELSLEDVGSDNGSQQSSISMGGPSDEERAEASDADEGDLLPSWDDQEMVEQSDEHKLCPGCRNIPFMDIWRGKPVSKRWTGVSGCPICAILESLIPPESDGKLQSLICFHPDSSLSFRLGEPMSFQRPAKLQFKRLGKYDIVVRMHDHNIGYLTNLSIWGWFDISSLNTLR